MGLHLPPNFRGATSIAINFKGVGQMFGYSSGDPHFTTPLAPRPLRPQADTASKCNNDAILILGQLDASQFGAGLADALRGGLIVSVGGAGLAAPEIMTFPGVRCIDLGTIQCLGEGRTVARFRPKVRGTPNRFDVRITAQGRSFQPPLTTAGVTVALSLGGRDASDRINSCKVSGRRSQTANCRK
jgi:hypothetical protein